MLEKLLLAASLTLLINLLFGVGSTTSSQTDAGLFSQKVRIVVSTVDYTPLGQQVSH
jgi:hypothetical protein